MPHPHLALSPTSVRLGDLPAEGRHFVYTDQSGELSPYLADLIGKNSYRVEIEVKPMGNVYSAHGKIETGLNEICSLCAIEFVHRVNESFQEILVIQDPASPKDHQVRVNHSSELRLDGPECTELKNDIFQIGDFIHELVAIAAPMKPLGRPDCDSTCENYQEAVSNGWLTAASEPEPKGPNPFAVLKELKLRD